LTFAVRVDHPADEALFHDLLHDLRCTTASAIDVPTYTVSRSGAAQRTWSIEGPRVDRYVSHDVSDVVARFLAGLSVATLDASPERLHLHAAAASRDDGAVLIAAERHTGKTTTVANLVARGWCFITDEMVVIDKPPYLRGVPRPLGIKPGGSEHLRMRVEANGSEPADPESFRYVAVGSTGAPVCEGAIARVVVLLRRPNAPMLEPLVERLHPADAAVALMQETLDAGRYGAEAVVRLAELAAATTSVRVMRGSPDRTVDIIIELAEAGVGDPSPVRRFTPSDAIDPAVVALTIRNRAVVHHTGSGVIFALDEAATRVWETIGGWAMYDEIDLDGPVVSRFVGQLRELGVLTTKDTRE
jgi:hypothetical protein